MSTLITVLHVIVCLFLMLTVLLQSGKGGGMGAAFGGGNAATVFGGSGASGFLKRLTAIAGSIFMVTSMVLAFLSSRNAADALETFGSDQQKISREKDKAKEAALRAAKQNLKTTPLPPPSMGPNGPTPPAPTPGSATPPAPAPGSATTPAPAPGSATTPAPAPVEQPAPAPGSAAKPSTTIAPNPTKP